MLAGHEGDLQLGAHTVCARHEDGFAESPGLQLKEAAKRSNVGEHAGRERRAGEATDTPHRFVAGVYINAGSFVIHLRIPASLSRQRQGFAPTSLRLLSNTRRVSFQRTYL